MTILIFTMIFLTTMFLYTNSPLMSALIIVAQSLVISLLIFYSTSMTWYSFILLMVFLSGMMIIFTYVSSLAPNQIMTYQPALMLLLTSLTALLALQWSPLLVMNEAPNNLPDSFTNSPNDSLFKLFTAPTGTITLFLISYLFLALIVVVKTTKLTSGPLLAKF